MLAIEMTKTLTALLAVACLPSAEAFGSIPVDELQPQKYMHFPEFYDIPRTMNEATTAGWTEWNAGESCASRGGHVFARPETHPDSRSWGLLPALIFTGWGELAGVIFALDKRFILQSATDVEAAPWSHGDLRGHASQRGGVASEAQPTALRVRDVGCRCVAGRDGGRGA